MSSTNKPSNEQLRQWHEDPDNWRWGIIYYNLADPRVWLPKRIPMMGWTLNFARPLTYLILMLFIVTMVFIQRIAT